jgi:hypothetical protein
MFSSRPLVAGLVGLVSEVLAQSQTVGNIKIGPANQSWVAAGVKGGLVFDLTLDDAGHHCTVNVGHGRNGSGTRPVTGAMES